MANTLRMRTTLSAMESYFPLIWVHPWVYRHGIVETSSSCTTKSCMQVSLRPSSLVRKRVYNWASATKGANWFPSLALWLADILRPVYSHFSPEWGLIPSYFLVPYTVEEGARDYFKCASFIQHMWCSCCCHVGMAFMVLTLEHLWLNWTVPIWQRLKNLGKCHQILGEHSRMQKRWCRAKKEKQFSFQ